MKLIEVGIDRINLENLAYAKATGAGDQFDGGHADRELEMHFVGMTYALKLKGDEAARFWELIDAELAHRGPGPEA